MVTYAKKETREPQSIRERLRHFRQHKGLLQSDMAEIIKITGRGYAAKELGTNEFSCKQVKRLALHFNLNLYWLFFGEGGMTRQQENI